MTAPKIVGPGEGSDIKPFGIAMNVMLRAEDTGGSFASLVATLDPGQGPPPHFHHDHDEYFYILEGTFALSVAGRNVTAGPGTMVYVPRETVHAFTNIATTPGKILEWGLPGGQERYFEAIDQLGAKGQLNPESVVATSKAFETEFVI